MSATTLERSYFLVWSARLNDGGNCRRRQAPAAVFVADARRQKYEPGFNTDLRLPLAGDTLSSAREGRVQYVQCEERRYCVPSVIDLTGGGKTRRRVGLPSLSDLTVEEARWEERDDVAADHRSAIWPVEKRDGVAWREMASHTIGQRSDRWGRDRETGSSRVYTCRECRDRHDVKHYRSAIHLIGSVWRRSRDRRPSLGAGVRTARPREGECRQL